MVVAATLFALPASASAAAANGVEHLHFAAGPYKVIPGANLILDQFNDVPKPKVNGFMIRMQPNLVYALPGRQVLRQGPGHEHRPPAPRRVAEQRRGRARARATAPTAACYPFMAAGEEKTTYEFPQGVMAIRSPPATSGSSTT